MLGLWGIRRQGSVWRDEVVTYDMANRTLPELLGTLEHFDAVHGLYYLFMHGLFAVFGGDLTTLRLPSVFAMAASAAGVGLLGHRFAGPRAGLFAGLVFALIPAVQQYAQEGRSYAVVCALVTWATYLLVRAATAPSRGRWIGYTVVALIACLMHEFAVLMLTAHGATMLFSDVSRPVRRAWSLSAVCVVAGLTPLAVVSMGQTEQVRWIMWPDPLQLATFALFAVVGLWCARRTPGRLAGGRTGAIGPIRLRTLAVPLLILPTAVLLLVSHLKPMFVDRYVLYYVIGFALLTGAALDRAFRPRGEGGGGGGVGRGGGGDGSNGDGGRTEGSVLRRPWARPVAVAGVLLVLLPVSVHLRSPESRKDDATAVSKTVRKVGRPGDGLLFTPARRRVWMLAQPGEYHGLSDLALAKAVDSSGSLYGKEVAADRIRDRILAKDRIVVLGDPAGDPLDETRREAVKRETLRDHFVRCSSEEVTGARVMVYTRPGRCAP
ncbi:glycosyltransferase family 39 protein [Streptomyces sp. NPDC002851]